jgi:hypothetical protein
MSPLTPGSSVPTPSEPGTPSNGSGSGDGARAGSEPILWPEGLGPVGGLLVSAGDHFETLRQGLISAFGLPYAPGVQPGTNPGDDVTKPFLEFFLSSKKSGEELVEITGRALGLHGDETKVTDGKHLSADEINTDISKSLHK